MVDFSPPETLLAQLIELRKTIQRDAERCFRRWQPFIQRPMFRQAAWNLAHYLAFERAETARIQRALQPWGLSSLGSNPSSIMPQLEATVATLGAICRINPTLLPQHPSQRSFFRGDRLLERHRQRLFGDRPSTSPESDGSTPEATPLLVVSLPPEGADDGFFHNCLTRGAIALRIDGAQCEPEVWQPAIEQLRRVESQLDRPSNRRCAVWFAFEGGQPRIERLFGRDACRPRIGDRLLLCQDAPTADAIVPTPFTCTTPELVSALKVGDRIWVEQNVGARAISKTEGDVLLEVFAVRSPDTAKLRSHQWIDCPDTPLESATFSPRDEAQFATILEQADCIELPQVRHSRALGDLHNALKQHRASKSAPTPRVLLHLDGASVMPDLPDLLAVGGGRYFLGVMLSQDAAADRNSRSALGTAQRQQEILKLCRAACVPVVWLDTSDAETPFLPYDFPSDSVVVRSPRHFLSVEASNARDGWDGNSNVSPRPSQARFAQAAVCQLRSLPASSPALHSANVGC